MTLAAGSRIGKYEILAPLGAGGMGEVYRALDPHLRREVAIKILHADVFTDPLRRRRLEQEARTAGALNHPNLLTIYDLDEHDGAPFIVSELLMGQTLREAMTGGALPPRKAIALALQIAAGLEAAHEKGIVHRDLKPENIFVTPDGRVKILDFGLAKISEPIAHDDSTHTVMKTAPGTLMGTLAYMSPEQVRAEAADERSDIFAFGSVLYEMLWGRFAFRKASGGETIAAILTEDPMTSALVDVAPGLVAIVQHCLEKDPDRRFQTAHDLAFALRSDLPPSPSIPIAPSRSKRRGVLVAGFVLAAALLAALMLPMRRLWPREVTETHSLKSSPPVNAAARDAVLRGRSYIVRGDPESLNRSLLYFKQAVKSDPNYAPAYAGVADAYEELATFGVMLPTEAFPPAKEAALTALRLDPNLAEAHASLGMIQTKYDWDWKAADESFRRAIELNPQYDLAHEEYALLLMVTGHADQAIAHCKRAFELSPLGRQAIGELPFMFYLAHQYDASIAQYRRAIELDPESLEDREGAADAYAAAGRNAEAFAQYQQWAHMARYPEPIIDDLARSYASAGMPGYWRKRLRMEQIEEEETHDVFTYRRASLHARLHQTDQSLEWLERAYAEHNGRLIYLRVDPVFDALHREPRFENLAKRIGLP